MASPETADATEPSLSWLGEPGFVLRPLATIWATVELERALVDLGIDAARAVDAIEDPLLGARVVVVAGDDATIALAEPSTEGRLAASLARHGEGPAGRYLGPPLSLDVVRARAAAAGVTLSRSAVGPFGPSLLVLGRGRLGDASVILADPAAVPSRP